MNTRGAAASGIERSSRLAAPSLEFIVFAHNFWGKSRVGTGTMEGHPSEATPPALAPVESNSVIAHLNMLQAVVTRLAGNSAQCKTWCVAIVSALFGLAGATKSGQIAVAAIIPIVVFGFVDAAYLANEKAYRDLYNSVVEKIRNRTYGLADYANLSAPADAGHYLWALSSWSVWPVYLGLIIAYVVVLLSGLLRY
jgi:hypothetical protein